MGIKAYIDLINTVGFPVFFCVWLMRRDERREIAAKARAREDSDIRAEVKATHAEVVECRRALRDLVNALEDEDDAQ